MANEAYFSAAGYIATDPIFGATPSGVPTLTMRLAWTPRRLDRATGAWVDEPSSFATVKCFRKIAENGRVCLRKGEPVLVTGTMRVREYEAKDGGRRANVDIVAASIGHDLARGVTTFQKVRQSTELTAAERDAAERDAAGRAVSAADESQGQEGGEAQGQPGGEAGPDGAALAGSGPAVPGADEMAEEFGELEDAMEPVAAPF
jgi:single-strand DNA-binding protein